MKQLAVGVAQTTAVPGDVAANIAQHLTLIDAAAEHGPEVLVFPELSLTGYELDRCATLAFELDDERLAPLKDAADGVMTIVVGAPVRVGTMLHIGAVVIAPDRTLEVYTKRHLGAFPPDAGPGRVPPPEASIFSPGTLDPLIALKEQIAAVAVCADIHHATHAEEAAGRGARAYLASMFSIPADIDADIEHLRTYARRHRMTVAMANHGAPSGGLPAAGRSSILDDTGRLVVQLPEDGAGVAVGWEGASGWRSARVLLQP